MRYVALLRAINLGGKRVIKMAALRDMVVSAGATDVVTYIASGNVVFEHADRSTTALTTKLAHSLSNAAGFDVTLTLRTARELAALTTANPFAGEPVERLQVLFLPSRVPASALAGIDAAAYAPERFVLTGRELYFCLPNGVARSVLMGKLASAKSLAGGTMRNWRTVTALVALTTA